MKIAIIAHACRVRGGLFQTANLLKALKNVAQNERFLLICSAGCGLEKIGFPDHTEIYIYRGRHGPIERYWFELVTLPKIVDSYSPDVVYSPGNIGLTKSRVPQVLFVRNAYLFDNERSPDMYLSFRLRVAALRAQMRRSLRGGTELIFCQTPVVKRRFSNAYHYPQERIVVLGFPPPDEIKPVADSEVPAIFDKSSHNFYVLLLTPYMPHRNPGVLIPLCKRYAAQIREKQIKFITTVRAQDHPRAGAFLKEVCRHHLEDVIINVGSLSREDVARHLCCSHLLWLPTLLECLPTPYLEAMSVGVPILAPDLDFATYVCGEAGIYYDSSNLDDIFEKIVLLCEDEQLRRQLTEKGKLQLQDGTKFPRNWDEVAATTLQELRKLTM